MIRFLKIFLGFVTLYHVLVTLVIYGFFGGQFAELPSLLRDGVWFVFILAVVVYYRKHIKEYLIKWKYPRIVFLILMGFGIGMSLLKGKGMFDIFIGIKYGFFYIFIFLSSTLLGFFAKDKLNKIKNLNGIVYFLIGIVVVGFVWQILKLINPDLFFKFGYGPLNDFFFGQNPPIYYLTGFKGTLRWQGIFSGPNNYGYFLIAFFPLVIMLWKSNVKRIRDIFKLNLIENINQIFLLVWILAILFTLSRTAIIGGFVALLAVNFQWFKKHNFVLWGIICFGFLGILGLSWLKGVSTLDHIVAKFSSVNYVIQNPLGLGLGTSGPAIHYNGTILPENYFIQIMIDIGTIGFLIWAFFWYYILIIEKNIKKYFENNNGLKDNEKIFYMIWKCLNIGWICLLIMGIFLHVFEDSMVNYLFFISYGVMTGYLTKDL